MTVATLMIAIAFGSAVPDDFTRVVDAMVRGDDPRAAIRRDAGRTLAETGAHAVDGTRNLAVAWGATAAPTFRDRALGPGYRIVAVGAGGNAHFEQVFLAGQRARIAVVAHGTAPPRLAVTDDDGLPQCGANDAAGRCDWVPLWTTRYRIDLKNAGVTTASYTVVVQ